MSRLIALLIVLLIPALPAQAAARAAVFDIELQDTSGEQNAPSHAGRIQATTEAGNLPEQKALEKIGFRREGVMRAVGYRAGRWVDGVIYSLLRDDERPSR